MSMIYLWFKSSDASCNISAKTSSNMDEIACFRAGTTYSVARRGLDRRHTKYFALPQLRQGWETTSTDVEIANHKVVWVQEKSELLHISLKTYYSDWEYAIPEAHSQTIRTIIDSYALKTTSEIESNLGHFVVTETNDTQWS